MTSRSCSTGITQSFLILYCASLAFREVYEDDGEMHEDEGFSREELMSTKPGEYRCIPGSMFTLNMSQLAAAISGFVAPALSCDDRPKSTLVPEACVYRHKYFLRMVYARGIEAMRVGVPRSDAFGW
jgi:hypothetical protein